MNKTEFVSNFIAIRKRNLQNASHGVSDWLLKEQAENEYQRQKTTNKNLNPMFEEEFKEMHERFRIGDPIDDDELVVLLDFYRDLEFKLHMLGERFHFAWRDALDQSQRLMGYQKARLEKRK